jgi:ATP-binding cassette subfamily F protein uup
LQDYPGTLLLVSHDRRFLDNIVTQVVVSEGGGTWREYVGGYSDWLEQRPKPRPAPGRAASQDKAAPVREKPRTKMSYQRQRELEALPGEIEKLEQEQSELNARMSSPDYHRNGVEQLKADRRRAEELEALLLEKFERWEALEQERSGYA